jgi:hypothetical protein
VGGEWEVAVCMGDLRGVLDPQKPGYRVGRGVSRGTGVALMVSHTVHTQIHATYAYPPTPYPTPPCTHHVARGIPYHMPINTRPYMHPCLPFDGVCYSVGTM